MSVKPLHRLVIWLAILCMFSVPWATGQADSIPPEGSTGDQAQGSLPEDPASKGGTKEEGGIYDHWHQPVMKTVIGPGAPAATDRFGYQMDGGALFSWVEANSGTEVFLDGDRDDGYSDPIDLGFDFKFYEHSYDQVFVSTNGFLSFGGGSQSFSNRAIPANTPPDNLIAPFWDDLDLGDGQVFFERRDEGGGRSLVVEWEQIYRYGSSDRLTFEVILYESGDIRFQYLSLEGVLDEATVGIEDGDGIDGSLYLYNAAGLTEGQAIHFSRPGPAPRLKVLPLYQSKFLVERQAQYQIEIINTNEVGSDLYNLTISTSQPGWKVSVQDAQRLADPDDTDGDGKLDTGPLPQGQAWTALLRVYSPGSRQAGESVEISLEVVSSDDPERRQMVSLIAAVPAPFLQAYADSAAGIYAGLASKYNLRQVRVDPLFTGNTLSVVKSPNASFLYGWERNGQVSVPGGIAFYSNIEYLVLNGFGEPVGLAQSLTQNESVATPTQLVNARYPALDSAPNGLTGVLWLQYIFDITTLLTNSNVFFAVVGPAGQTVSGPTNVTNNSGWSGGEDEVPMYGAPQVAATSDNRFVLAWMDTSESSSGEVSNLVTAIYSSDGGLIQGPQTLVENAPGMTQIIDPRLAQLSDKRVLAAYSLYDQGEQTYSVTYLILQSDGQIVRQPSAIPGSSGWRLDAAQFMGGNILLAWTNPSTEHISKAVLNDSGEILQPPEDIPALMGRIPDYVSLAISTDDYGVLTWMDAEWKDYLFYALVDPEGQIITQPMIWLTGSGGNPLIQTSFTGQGLAPYSVRLRNYLPLARRSD